MEAPLQHIAFIMDGNGRWAKQRSLARVEGHKAGAEKIWDVAKRAFEYWNIPYITLYAFSTENWDRPKSEIGAIFKLLQFYLKVKGSTFIKNKIRFRTIGDTSKLPISAQKVIAKLCESTQHFAEHTLVLALNYGARDEILHAIRSLPASEIQGLTWEKLRPFLYTADIPDPDLIIRTSGEQRLSNYLLLQAAYSELYFTKTYWPDFDAQALDMAIEDFLKRTRKFGKIE